jgi:hypothetical protein
MRTQGTGVNHPETGLPQAVDEGIRRQYERKGTFRTAQLLVQQRGFGGLYYGFRLHLRKFL